MNLVRKLTEDDDWRHSVDEKKESSYLCDSSVDEVVWSDYGTFYYSWNDGNTMCLTSVSKSLALWKLTWSFSSAFVKRWQQVISSFIRRARLYSSLDNLSAVPSIVLCIFHIITLWMLMWMRGKLWWRRPVKPDEPLCISFTSGLWKRRVRFYRSSTNNLDSFFFFLSTQDKATPVGR